MTTLVYCRRYVNMPGMKKPKPKSPPFYTWTEESNRLNGRYTRLVDGVARKRFVRVMAVTERPDWWPWPATPAGRTR